MSDRRSKPTVLAAATLCFAATVVDAQEVPRADRSRLSDRYSVTLGAYSVSANTVLRLDAPGGRVGTTVDFEDDLGIDREAWTRDFEFAVRFGDRHRFEIERFDFDRTGSRANLREISVGSNIYQVGWTLDTEFDTSVTRLGYAYSFSRNEKRDLGIHAGLHVTGLEMRIRAAIEPVTSVVEEFADTTAPLPVIGFHGAYRFLPKWTLYGRLQLFRLAVTDYEGAMDHAAIAIEHDTFRHFGFGLGFDYFDFDLDSTDASFLGNVRVRFYGPRLFVHTHF